MKQTELNKLLGNQAAATSYSPGRLGANYAGNGRRIPKGYTTTKAKAKVKTPDGNTVEMELGIDFAVDTSTYLPEMVVNQKVAELVEELCNKYPLITIDNEIFGEPRLKEHRFGVSDVLSAFCVYDSIAEIIEEHGNRYTEKELKDAVRFARDFLDSFYTDETNG